MSDDWSSVLCLHKPPQVYGWEYFPLLENIEKDRLENPWLPLFNGKETLPFVEQDREVATIIPMIIPDPYIASETRSKVNVSVTLYLFPENHLSVFALWWEDHSAQETDLNFMSFPGYVPWTEISFHSPVLFIAQSQ